MGKDKILVWKTTVAELEELAFKLRFLDQEIVLIDENTVLKVVNKEWTGKTCKKCGHKVSEQFTKCPYCGACLSCQ